jgi:hypothetical protein
MKLIKHKIAQMAEKNSVLDPNYEFVDVVDPELHDDITSIYNLANNGLLTGKDYQFLMTEIYMLMVELGGFNELSDDDKIIIVKLAICSYDEAIAYGITDAEFKPYVCMQANKTYIARNARIESIRQDFSFELKKKTMTFTQSNEMLAEIRQMFNDYVTGKNPALMNWVMDVFPTKEYYSAEIQTMFIDKLSGKY